MHRMLKRVGLSGSAHLRAGAGRQPPLAWHPHRLVIAASDGAHQVLVFDLDDAATDAEGGQAAQLQPVTTLAHTQQQQVQGGGGGLLLQPN